MPFQNRENKNKMRQLIQCGATPNTSVSFTSKLAFYAHNLGEKNAKKNPKIF